MISDLRLWAGMRSWAGIYAVLLLLGAANLARGERIKDIVDIQGIRSNPLTGIGLVIGLAGTGDTTLLSRQMLTNVLRDQGLVLSPTDVTGKNVAVVMVTAELGPFDREGARIDVDVSTLGETSSLQGAMLLATPLKGLDGQVYAVAQGGVSLGGWTVSGSQASAAKNHQTVGRIADGAIVEKSELATFIEQVAGQRYLTLNLRNNDFSTAQRICDAINQSFQGSTVVLDAGAVKVNVPNNVTQEGIIGFIDEITKKQVTVDMPASVVINERTGTIVVGENVGISAVAISQGSLVVKVKESAQVSQPIAPFSDAGTTVVIPETALDVQEQNAYLIPVSRAVTVSELAKALNAIGASPRDLVAIFNALKKAGALQAKLVIM
jgi:flagellar P-ring protein precursor FlgI